MTATPTDARPEVPELVVLDVNETLSDLGGLADAFVAVGLDPRDVETWFAGVLRDAFALTVLGDNPGFADVATATLRSRLAAVGSGDPDAAATEVLQALVALRPHPDVVPGLVALAGLGCRVVTLSNGSASVARTLLSGTDAEAVVEAYLSVEDAGRWKPAPEAYAHALSTTGVPADRALLVAVHPWDLEGAHRAGMRTAWLDRSGHGWPSCFAAPDVTARGFAELAERLGAQV
ncbi:haloacid dehalogenase type II [Phycicoccus sp. MAQZ13P-2]|uniref:haloacid dehalogenase type II n=1 Tax=Phycicoccus mangrovi TaxID=2840470 RepID=UPI001C00188C|nr:haloacid dehalogenase type II [Phycicoccus mangrovi]MBT9254575.1 haloacid dehalogenase type II [Phycicoccus mangrovi]MBT9273220.1 haloacid dehalogenase type II [Phycicoccus mangrovi]